MTAFAEGRSEAGNGHEGTVSQGQGSPATAGLHALLEPRSVAVVGASDAVERIGGRVLDHLRREFTGAIFPINPRRDTVQGLRAYGDIGQVDGEIDLAVLAVASELVPDAVRRCADHGVKAAIVISSGFAEVGDDTGRALQEELHSIRQRTGIRILGPNSMGSINLSAGLYATFAGLRGFPIAPGNVAVVSQSGAFGIRIFEGAQSEGLGISQMCLTGNEVDVTIGELAGHLLERDDVAVLTLFAEGIRNPELLLDAGRRGAELGKPIIFLKAGVSHTGGRAALSHTGSMMVGSRAFEAAMESVGIMVVPTLRHLLSQTKAFSPGRIPRGRRTCILTGSGGSGILLADHLESAGLEVPPTGPRLRAEIESLIPSFGSAVNPIDYTGQILNDASALPALLEHVCTSSEYDIVCLTGVNRSQPPEVLTAIIEACRRSGKPFFTWAPQVDVAYEMTRQGAPGFLDPQAMAEAAAGVIRYGGLRERALSRTRPTTTKQGLVAPGGGSLTESDAKRILRAYGIPVTREGIAASAHDAVALASDIGFPVVMKLSSRWLVHKSDENAVCLNLRNAAEVGEAFHDLVAVGKRLLPAGETHADVLVQEQVPAGIEILCGMVRDPLFGPIITVGAGGVLAEVMNERHDTLPPVTRQQARELVGRIWDGRLVSHRRGLGAAAIEELAGAIERFSWLALSETAIQEIDINPFIATGDAVIAVDALIVTAAAADGDAVASLREVGRDVH
ncbi:acetate--CoA ligase family protein [Streptosporangium amethystogenes]|uniref:acetate--CoA ligase family protein n=1 Tax=Streptosporangium amethystogenes TaxID=2002 RepID=UPI0006924B20|nr:acetate--CoA ligase family protein [Streptosporangium amethystogenes]